MLLLDVSEMTQNMVKLENVLVICTSRAKDGMCAYLPVLYFVAWLS